MPKYTTPALPYVPKLSSDQVTVSVYSDYSYREILYSFGLYESISYEVAEVTLPISYCDLLVAPTECTPENFKRLLDEGKLEELKKLEERCYVKADYVNRLVDCYRYIVEFLRELEKELQG